MRTVDELTAVIEPAWPQLEAELLDNPGITVLPITIAAGSRKLFAVLHRGCMDDDLQQVTIVRARYEGIYEPGVWIAFACWPGELSPDWNADDATCAGFFAERAEEIGGGDTPQQAYEDLQQRLAARRRRLRRT